MPNACHSLSLDEIEAEAVGMLYEAKEGIVEARDRYGLNERASLIVLWFSITTYLAATVAWTTHRKAVTSGDFKVDYAENEMASLQKSVLRMEGALNNDPPAHVGALFDRSRGIFFQTVLNNLSTDNRVTH